MSAKKYSASFILHNDKKDFILNDYEIKTIEAIQSFRTNPKYFKDHYLKSICLFLKRAKKDHEAEELSNIEYNDFQWNGFYLLSPGLCLAANDILHLKENKQEVHVQNICSRNLGDIKYDILDYYETEGDVEFIISKFLENAEDPNKTFRALLKEKSYNYIGVAQNDEDGKKVILFSRKAESNLYLNIHQYKQMLNSYKVFDVDKVSCLNLNSTLEIMDNLVYPIRHPLIYQVFKSFKNNVDYSIGGVTFLSFCNEFYKYNFKENQIKALVDLFSDYFKLDKTKLYNEERLILIKKIESIKDEHEESLGKDSFKILNALKEKENNGNINISDYLSAL